MHSSPSMEKEIQWRGSTQFIEFQEALAFALRNQDFDWGRGLCITLDIDPVEKLKSWTKPKKILGSASPSAFRVLLRFEPKVVNPYSYIKAFSGRYDLVVDFGLRSKEALPWPMSPKSLAQQPSWEKPRLDKFCLVNANKFSAVEGELYSLRKQIAGKRGDLDVFGRGWGEFGPRRKLNLLIKAMVFALTAGSLPSLNAIATWLDRETLTQGPVTDKHATLGKYRYAVVIENEASYLSEKLFDSLVAGCIPVYVGLNPLPAELEKLIVRSSPDLKSICDAMDKASQIERENWIAEVKSYFLSDLIRSNRMENVAEKVAQRIMQGIGQAQVITT